MANDKRTAEGERRRHHAVRDIFAQACVLLAPLVKENDKVLNTSGFAMVHMVQDHFPELSASEAHIVIIAIEHLYRENRLQSLLEEYANSPKP